MAEVEGLALSVAVRRLREELLEAVAAGAGEELQFVLGPVELEFQVGVTNEGGGEAGVRFWVVTLGAKGSHAREETHSVKVTLTPKLASDPEGDVRVSSRGVLGA